MKCARGLVAAALMAALALGAPADAPARVWPRPAAGGTQSGDPEILFTFDDGPHEKWTDVILGALAAHRVQAIFFWVGHRVEGGRRGIERRRALVERAVREGHLIGNHTVNHEHLCHHDIDAAVEIDHNLGLYQTLTALPVVLFRAPYGDRCRKLEALLGDRGLAHLHWDIDPREYNGLTAEGTAQLVIGKIKRLRGRAVILMHDTHGVGARALPQILDWIVQENARRVRAGDRPIRILSGSDLVVERARGPLWFWGEDALSSARGYFGRSLASLVPGAPIAPAAAPPRVVEPSGSVLDSPTRTATLPAR